MSEVKVYKLTDSMYEDLAYISPCPDEFELVGKSDYDKLQDDLKKAVEALEFYASKDCCWVGICDEMSDDLTDLYEDSGDKARSVLKELRGENV